MIKEVTAQEIAKKLLRAIKSNKITKETAGEIAEGLYTMNEGGVWPDDVDSVGIEQCLLCWEIVEYILQHKELSEEFKI